jgi:CheY-like chemotaxis protein
MHKLSELKCILLVDDDDATNYINRLVIQQWNENVHVQICTNGQHALDYLSCQGEFSTESCYPQPGIIFLDINMPGMNGWDFLRKYEDLPQEQKAKVVMAMLTTSLNSDDEVKANNFHTLKGFHNKPLTIDIIDETVTQNFK